MSNGEIIKGKNTDNFNAIYKKAANAIIYARAKVATTVNIAMVELFWNIGSYIVEEEQNGEDRAKYGAKIIEKLSERLLQEFGKGFSVRNLEDARKLYLEYPVAPIDDIHIRQIPQSVPAELSRPIFTLSWTHYKILLRITRPEIKKFYEIECAKHCWSSRELERQIASLLFERLAANKDKNKVMRLSLEGQEISTAEDVIKDPLVLEFLGLPESPKLLESTLESNLITHLQKFLLELGKGFAFIARQKRLTIGHNHYYADLVFYHTILKCYIIVDLKTKPLTHGDLGQIQLYVNYFDQEVKMGNDNPTIGLVLCSEKDDQMVKYFLGDKAKQIFASKYQFHLPSIEELEKELKKEIKEIKDQLGDNPNDKK